MSNKLSVQSTDKPTLIPQAHGGALHSGGTKGNRGHILRKRKQYVAWLALGELKDRLTTPLRRRKIKDADLIGVAKLDSEFTELPRQPDQSGEAMMAKVLTLMGRALLAAPPATRTEMLGRLTAIEAKVTE